MWPALGWGSLCTSSLGFPAPNLTLSQSEVSEWTVVSVECKAHAKTLVTLSGASAGSPAPSAQFLLNASAEDNGRSFVCSAAIEVAGKVLHKNKTQKLYVLCKCSCWTMTPNLQGPAPKTS